MRATANICVRLARVQDCEQIARMCAELWPDASAQEHLRELLSKVEGTATRMLPVAVFAAESTCGEPGANGSKLIGFVEVGRRSHADGCDESHPVGFIEGWFVVENWRGRGVGGTLVAAAEDWARKQGCAEIASDTWIDNKVSQRAHEALGYAVVDRCVNYRKAL
jgi:aminoglycoside 6'-N-acetyltransferase I